ncbi:MerR family transcriptional regulator [Pectinatus cerevisiiphilus]|uniref:DNA-binding transcriptional MerR regulator n=1 Tax=Pectinatus cerevisiiphilus TaxID=86956 RepID=A0A4R3K7H8_9FIRM|nr:MerR family transcriptional regulator [Pectinatus cerevisiiphilus]TCS78693.1 DNA-binding transcriptional MerR regulator [Pectinatus cerevisiiphilus]
MADIEISDMAKLMNLNSSTLRYYESIGLITDIKRNASGKRVYSERDIKWIEMIGRLRETGMNINKMKKYAQLRKMGDSTITERKNIMQEHLNFIENKIEELAKSRDYVAKKVEIYTKMEEKINGK